MQRQFCITDFLDSVNKLGVKISNTTDVSKIINASKCERCGNMSVIAEIKQLRSNDEEATKVTRCVLCDVRINIG